MPRRLELETTAALVAHLDAGGTLAGCVLQSLDLRPQAARLLNLVFENCLLLGCELTPELHAHALEAGALVFPAIPDLPYPVYRSALYTVEELLGNYHPGESGSYERTLDGRIFNHYHSIGGEHSDDIRETLAMRLHDHAVTDELRALLPGRKVVAIMGGHTLRRDDPSYLQVARLARRLAQTGFLLVSGGGPGGMEATHLGAWFAGRGLDELDDAVRTLSGAALFEPKGPWFDKAFEVRDRYPLSDETRAMSMSIGVPTWLYGHEPPNAFATHIAKYFSNSVREEGLLAIATNGVVFAPGGPGTVQEVFQEAAQNHYKTFGEPTPMIFLGEAYWKWKKPVYPLLAQLATGQEYGRWLAISDDVDAILAQLMAFDQTRPAPRVEPKTEVKGRTSLV